ncbi:MAG: DinB family protein [Thermoanaerobaculia bacterium]
MPGGSQLALDSVRLLAEGRALLERLDDAVFVATPAVQLGAVGSHFRHCFDFYLCFLAGLERGSVDYEAREREARIEGDRWRAMQVAGELETRLAAVGVEVEGHELAVASGTGTGGNGGHRSTVGRELQFLASHTLHHYALIAALLRLQGVEPGQEFGVAAGTLEHRRVSAQ